MSLHQATTALAFARVDALPDDWPERFTARAAGAIEDAPRDGAPVWGWAPGTDPLGTLDASGELADTTLTFGGYPYLSARRDQRKLAPQLLRAECRRLETAYLASLNPDGGHAFLPRKLRRELAEQAKENLLQSTPATFTATGVALVPGLPTANLALIECAAPRRLDAVIGCLAQTLGQGAVTPMTPEHAAWDDHGIDPLGVDWIPAAGHDGPTLPGAAFLTWLLWRADLGDTWTIDGSDVVAFIEGPLCFAGAGACGQAVIRQGDGPTRSAETLAALRDGKLLTGCRLSLVIDTQVYACRVNAVEFTFSGLALPPGEALDPADHFTERLVCLDRFRRAWYGLYAMYLASVTGPDRPGLLADDYAAWLHDFRPLGGAA